MSKIIPIIYAALAGICTALEAFTNGELGRHTTPVIATFFTLATGALFFLAAAIFSGNMKHIGKLVHIHPVFLFSGIFGALIIFFTIKAIPSLGVSNTLTLIIAFQMMLGLAIDVFVLKEQVLHLYKIIGVSLLFIGTFFVMN
jgi:bacterial/archaeal transporter family-2 protein